MSLHLNNDLFPGRVYIAPTLPLMQPKDEHSRACDQRSESRRWLPVHVQTAQFHSQRRTGTEERTFYTSDSSQTLPYKPPSRADHGDSSPSTAETAARYPITAPTLTRAHPKRRDEEAYPQRKRPAGSGDAKHADAPAPRQDHANGAEYRSLLQLERSPRGSQSLRSCPAPLRNPQTPYRCLESERRCAHRAGRGC